MALPKVFVLSIVHVWVFPVPIHFGRWNPKEITSSRDISRSWPLLYCGWKTSCTSWWLLLAIKQCKKRGILRGYSIYQLVQDFATSRSMLSYCDELKQLELVITYNITKEKNVGLSPYAAEFLWYRVKFSSHQNPWPSISIHIHPYPPISIYIHL